MDIKAMRKEKLRLYRLLNKAEVPRQKQQVLESIIDNMAWQRVKLDEAREQMQEEELICKYDNGGGQVGIRENPLYKAYINLWRAYMIGLEKYTSFLPKEVQEEVTNEGQSVLAIVKQMQKTAQ